MCHPFKSQLQTSSPQQFQLHKSLTDGPRQNELSGARLIIVGNSNLGNNPSVYQCELFAILAATTHLQSNSITSTQLNFFADSLSCVHSLSESVSSSDLLITTINSLNELANHSSVQANQKVQEIRSQIR